MTMPDGFSGDGKKPKGNSGKNLGIAILIVGIVLVASVGVGNLIWDSAHQEVNDQRAFIDKIEQAQDKCKRDYGNSPQYHACMDDVFKVYEKFKGEFGI